MKEFIDIEIVGVDKNKIKRVSPEKDLYYVYFKLSTIPTSQWSIYFSEERKFPRHTMWRHAGVEGGYIVIKCALEEVKEIHLRDLKLNVLNVNKKYKEFLKSKEIEEKKSREKIIKEREKIEKTLEDLDFD